MHNISSRGTQVPPGATSHPACCFAYAACSCLHAAGVDKFFAVGVVVRVWGSSRPPATRPFRMGVAQDGYCGRRLFMGVCVFAGRGL